MPPLGLGGAMLHVDEKPETTHLYVVREELTKLQLLPIILSFLALLILVVVCALLPYQEPVARAVIRVPAIPLPFKTYSAQAAIIPTGIKTYPATFAHGTLTLTNGSIISQELPRGFILTANNGIEVATDSAVFVPAGNANGYGLSTVSAHLLTLGINMSTLSINQVIGSSLYVRNLQPLTGGHPAYSVKFETSIDRELALSKARDDITSKVTGLHYPCLETIIPDSGKMSVTWSCQFVTYSIPSYMHSTSVKLQGNNLLVAVWFIPHTKRIWIK